MIYGGMGIEALTNSDGDFMGFFTMVFVGTHGNPINSNGFNDHFPMKKESSFGEQKPQILSELPTMGYSSNGG